MQTEKFRSSHEGVVKLKVVFVTGQGGAGFHSPEPALTQGRGGYSSGNPRPAPVRGPFVTTYL